jgi:hypothetical protein
MQSIERSTAPGLIEKIQDEFDDGVEEIGKWRIISGTQQALLHRVRSSGW